jgi:hypothetical protein
MKLSFLLTCLGGLLAATTLSWSQMWDRRSFKQLYQDARAGRVCVRPLNLIVSCHGER